MVGKNLANLLIGILVVSISATQLKGAVIGWNFGVTEGSVLPSQLPVGTEVGAVSCGNSYGNPEFLDIKTPSSGYSNASGNYNINVAARTGDLNTAENGSAYFEFTLAAAEGFALLLEGLYFGSRSTSTGPQMFCLRSNRDGFNTDLGSGALNANSKWALQEVALNLTVTTEPLTLRLYGYGGSGNAQSGTANWRIDDLTVTLTITDSSALAAPVALAADNVTSTSFTAQWSEVADATGYLFDLYQITTVGAIEPQSVFEESFDNFSAITTNQAAHGTDISLKLDEFTETTGWSGDKVYQAGGAVKMGTTSVKGWLMTPPIDLSGHDGLFEVSFQTCAWEGDATEFDLFHVDGTTTNLLEQVTGLDNVDYTFKEATVNGSGGTSESRLLFAAKQASKARFFIDELTVSQGRSDGVPQTNFICQAAALTTTATNLNVASPGLYYYRVQAFDAEQSSDFSNEIAVDTTTLAQPPQIAQLLPQTLRAGETLNVNIIVEPTDNDPVTATNVTAVGEVFGVWSLVAGVFSFTPDTLDLGERQFSFTATDKDGCSDAMILTVTVLRPQLAAIVLSSAEGEYTQDFAALATETTAEWDNLASPLPGWSAFAGKNPVITYRTGSGGSSTGGIYAWNKGEGKGWSLGSLASSNNRYIYGAAFTNATGAAIVKMHIGFTAEQWRMANVLPHRLTFEYSVNETALPLLEGEWRPLNNLAYESPLLLENENSSASAVYAGQRLEGVLPRPLAAGEVIRFRWNDPDDTGNDHAFGISDFTLAWETGEQSQAIAVGRNGAQENFDEMGDNTPASLPWMWRVGYAATEARVSGSYAEALNELPLTIKKVNFSETGSYNFDSSLNYDRAPGSLPGGNNARSVTLYAKLFNDTTSVIRRWNITYTVEKHRNGTESTAMQLLVSTDGGTWVSVGTPTSFTADANEQGYETAQRPAAAVIVNKVVEIDAALQPGALFFLAWQTAATTGNPESGMQALALDDFSIIPLPPTGTILIMR